MALTRSTSQVWEGEADFLMDQRKNDKNHTKILKCNLGENYPILKDFDAWLPLVKVDADLEKTGEQWNSSVDKDLVV
jgi:hypothetical protein